MSGFKSFDILPSPVLPLDEFYTFSHSLSMSFGKFEVLYKKNSIWLDVGVDCDDDDKE